jgi:hypothetical protein
MRRKEEGRDGGHMDKFPQATVMKNVRDPFFDM